MTVENFIINPSSKPSLSEISARRRSLLRGSLGIALGSFLGGSLPLLANEKPSKTPSSTKQATGKQSSPRIGFKSVDVQLSPDFDRVLVAEGYSARAFFSWGDEVVEGAAPWLSDASNHWREQALQAGQNHDGMAYFPFADAPNDHGLLVINHEYTNSTLHPNGPTERRDAKGFIYRPTNEVKKEQMAHGVSVIEIKRDKNGNWQRIKSSRNRRITLFTPMQISGPAAGSELLKTVADPTGKQVLGTLNNCSMGRTPWGTYLICEENWNNYFVNRDKVDFAQRKSHNRNGIANGLNSEKYFWESVDPRFNATPDNSQAFAGYVNEPNRFGWVVEFDPFDPLSVPIKRTAMGRYLRECASVFVADTGKMAIYSGDDTRGEYIYKFVPATGFDKANTKRQNNILDTGILYVARFNADGTGQWLPLIAGNGGLTARNGFASQADVVVNTRAAADIVGATPMDRPEWVAIDPHSKTLYASLTNNIERGIKPDQPTNAANARSENHHGQIIRWQEKDADPTATEFTWEIFLLAGKAKGTNTPANQIGDIKGDLFSCPDGLWFDGDGRLWIETDFDDEKSIYAEMGTNQLLCANPVTREVKRFLVGPRGCEITGLTGTPDGKSLWLNIQHPQISYPASDGKTRPRSTTVLVTKNDGGVIGS
ncbi:MAG TPA: PhoX family phosphatase [Cellvibrio sp.]|nr:PhoX family phosphatase [Cellvibrio sp.]